MMPISAIVLMMCVAVCVQENISSGTTEKKKIEETTQDTDAVLDQVLQELRYLRDEDKKNKEEINNLKAKVQKNDDKNKDEIHHLKDEDKKKTDEINNLKDEDKQNKDDITSLKVEDIKNRDENKKNRDEIDNLKVEVQNNKDKNKDEIHHLKSEDKKNKDRIENLTELHEKNMNEINILKGQTTNSGTAVASAAFTAVMDAGYHYPNVGDVIPFNTVWLNIGQHYDDQTSVFTCAESGLYLFSVTLYSSDIRSGTAYYRLSGALMLDGENLAEIYSYNLDPDHYQRHQSAVTAVVECPRGGSVWVECQESGGQMWGSATDPRSVFTGFAITYNIHP